MVTEAKIDRYGHGEYFGALDGFRGVLALLVAIYHTVWLSWFNDTAFMHQGTVIIDLFFVFSGFLMFRLYQGRLTTKAQGKAFIRKRFARLYPVHFVMTMVFLAFALLRVFAHKVGLSVDEPGEILPFAAGADETVYSLLTNLSLTQAMGLNDSLSYNPPAWTISVEFFAYFVFTAMMIWAAPKKIWHFVLMAVAVGATYFGLSRVKPNMDITYDLAFFRCLGGFFTGVIAAKIYGWLLQKRQDKTAGILDHGAEIIALLAYILFVIYCPGKLQFLVGPFAFLFVLVFAFDRGFISRFMMQKPFRYLAKISYSVYMVHVIIAIFANIFAERFLATWFGERFHNAYGIGDLYLLPYLAVVIFCAHMLQKYVEAPGVKWLARSRARPAKPEAVTA